MEATAMSRKRAAKLYSYKGRIFALSVTIIDPNTGNCRATVVSQGVERHDLPGSVWHEFLDAFIAQESQCPQA